MAWSIGDDEFPFGGREISVSHIDRDALFSLGPQAVGNQRRVELSTGGSMNLAFVFKLRKLILVDHLAIVQETSNQGAFPIVDAAASNEPKQLFAFVLFQVCQDVLGD